ncbi:hypothetical protein [Paenibacillus sp. J22TS3]|uniref:hypothetical protein n=1 Tax=Paenibacillus sp. J22TS3 TaxID=2807192 RepID=UPI001B1A7B90|nr:hypothetical protein [Paenibacillus sp. J22TS3]GIP22308.1 hypothetical protein J22TS3_25830 [Paenibacillus sp. J22TS3]
MKEAVVELNHGGSERRYSLIAAILFWCGLVVISSLYITMCIVSENLGWNYVFYLLGALYLITAILAVWTLTGTMVDEANRLC